MAFKHLIATFTCKIEDAAKLDRTRILAGLMSEVPGHVEVVMKTSLAEIPNLKFRSTDELSDNHDITYQDGLHLYWTNYPERCDMGAHNEHLFLDMLNVLSRHI